MLYLIGGVARTGKTTLSNRLLKHVQMPCVPLDALRFAILKGLPEADFTPRPTLFAEARSVERVFLPLAANLESAWDNACVEGALVLPRHVTRLQNGRRKISEVFLIRSSVTEDEVVEHEGPNNWFSQCEPDLRKTILRGMLKDSLHIERECTKKKFPVVDLSEGTFRQAQTRALNHLLKRK